MPDAAPSICTGMICRRASRSARWSRSIPRRWGSIRIATGCAWCSSRPATGMRIWCSSIPPALGGHGFDCPNLKRAAGRSGRREADAFRPLRRGGAAALPGITVAPVNCTKIAAKLVRTFTDRHGLKDLCKELLGSSCPSSSRPPTGARRADAGAARLRRVRRAAPACAVGEAGGAADPRGAAASWPRPASRSCRRAARLDLLGYEEPDIFAH